MTPCPSCRRHLVDADATCPFCGTSRSPVFAKAFNTVGSVVTALVLAACYGSPPGKFDDSGPDTSALDADGDGYDSTADCDDANDAINPGATEDCADTIDNDCDTLVDTADDDCATP